MSLSGFPGLAIYTAVIFAFATAVTALVLRHLRIIDVPNERSSHSAPTPRGGGIAIVGGFFLALTLIQAFGDTAATAPLRTLPFIGFLVAVLLIGGISLHDDVAGRGFSSKLVTQLVAVAVVMACGGVIDARQLGLGAFSSLAGLSWVGWPLTLFWMVGLTNAYNFMDGLDGMAGGTAAIASAFFALICALHGHPFAALAALAISAGSCGFLLFNWPPAKIFMGDIGSTFLGFAFAALAVLAANEPPTGAGNDPALMLFTMPLLLLHFLFDTVFTFCRRLLGGENVVQAHRTHLYQLLNRSGLTHRRVSLIYAGMAALQGLGAVWMTAGASDDASRLWIFLPFLFAHALHALWLTGKARRLGLIA